MSSSSSPFPELAALTAGLQTLLDDGSVLTGQVSVRCREPILQRSSFPCEVVTCQDAAGRELKLFCKYDTTSPDELPNHRHGVAYEAGVYRHVLRGERWTVPAFLGSRHDPESSGTWLILEYLEHADPLAHTLQPAAVLRQAACWIAAFHAANEAARFDEVRHHLNVYDDDYYLGWIHRAAEFTRPLHGRYPWMPQLFAGLEPSIQLLLGGPVTVIHGEYEANNILARDGQVHVIDWESAALAAGVIDLANLMWGWAGEVARLCVEDYQRSRWPHGPPAGFERQLTAARLYLACRWLGDRPEWTTADAPPVNLEELHALGKQAGYL